MGGAILMVVGAAGVLLSLLCMTIWAGRSRDRAAGLLGLVALLVAFSSPPSAGTAHAAVAKVTLTPASGVPGTSVSLSGSGFASGKRVLVKAGGRVLGRARTSRRGRFRLSASIPDGARGRVIKVVTARKGTRVVNRFQRSARPSQARELATERRTSLRATPYRASTGTTVRVAGARFQRKQRVRIALGPIRITGGRTTKSGAFSKRFVLPPMRQRSYRLAARAGHTRLSLGFTVADDPLVAAAGDIACDAEKPDFVQGLGTARTCHMKQTSDLILGLRPDVVLALGDTQYEAGTPPDFRNSYDPTWGRFKSITRPIIGNHEYGHQNGAGYFDYFGPLAGPRPQGYYSFDVGTWHLVALNSNCDKPGVTCGEGSPQEQWLRTDLAAHPTACTLAYIHDPFFSSTTAARDPRLQAFFKALYEAGADVVLVGSSHHYERFAPQAPGGVRDPAKGIREFVVGTGGRDLRPFSSVVAPNSEVRNADTFGVLTVRLRTNSYDWQFVPERGGSFTDAGSQACH